MFLRVPARDWARVSTGRQRDFRRPLNNVAVAYTKEGVRLPLPCFVVLYRTEPKLDVLMVLEEVRRERLIEISEEGLARAGYTGPRDEAFARFRQDWMIGERKRFEPNREVVVFTVRPTSEDDVALVGRNLIYHLYGEHLAAQE